MPLARNISPFLNNQIGRRNKHQFLGCRPNFSRFRVQNEIIVHQSPDTTKRFRHSHNLPSPTRKPSLQGEQPLEINTQGTLAYNFTKKRQRNDDRFNHNKTTHKLYRDISSTGDYEDAICQQDFNAFFLPALKTFDGIIRKINVQLSIKKCVLSYDNGSEKLIYFHCKDVNHFSTKEVIEELITKFGQLEGLLRKNSIH
ncbi:unnamed protein product [Ceratitis capitata]|uniref:(Mediterranean fruit fly) hypothetical protein n=1 Tax=Ceratitis capitata TaxID=7213 RepID=A0A811UT86_CERCA|nr:unnamed protein product [Ceratitis capitata]